MQHSEVSAEHNTPIVSEVGRSEFMAALLEIEEDQLQATLRLIHLNGTRQLEEVLVTQILALTPDQWTTLFPVLLALMDHLNRMGSWPEALRAGSALLSWGLAGFPVVATV